MAGDSRIQEALRLHQSGDYAHAETLYRQALARDPDEPNALHFLGLLLDQTERTAEAIPILERAVAVAGDVPHFLNNLAQALRKAGRIDDAIAAFQRALHVNPSYAIAHHNLAIVLASQGKSEDAIAHHQRAVQINPDLAAAHDALATLLLQSRRLDESLAHRKRSLELAPLNAAYHYNFGNLLKEQGYLDQAVEQYRQAIELNPKLVEPHQSLCYITYFSPTFTNAAILREHELFSQRHEAPLEPERPSHYQNEPDPDRRLRVAYVSPDFRQHPVGAHVLAILTAHDREQFEIYCYSDVRHPDGYTEKFKPLAHAWRQVEDLSDAQLAALVREDRIDILIDCALHMANNRLLMFARKPAPVQITHFGYPGTTGLEAMDYRISDPHLDPPGHDLFYSEKTLRLDHSFWCYNPLVEVAIRSDAPSARSGAITFGCLNNFCKVSNEAAGLFAQVMKEVPKSRLILQTPHGAHLERIANVLRQHGVDPGRVEYRGFLPLREYLDCYNDIDIILDCFPYNGHTTSLDALHMGVPIVTLVGETCVARAGVSHLRNLGLDDFIAATPEQFVTIAAHLASDEPRRRELHSTLRDRMTSSVLMDQRSAAQNLEALYRRAWRAWCESSAVGRS
ncbi:MAG TPA: tetratricopeptide repeat protein [Tepidisphaeraceae bacterium]|jgi:predicted O-linked N-acetylglucosamine transferase (SPINDLY family)